jgi:telomerase reverse transcriptase
MVGTLAGCLLGTDTIKTLIDVAFVLLTSRSRRERYPGYVCGVNKGEVMW